MTLLDSNRSGGKAGVGAHAWDATDPMRGSVKERFRRVSPVFPGTSGTILTARQINRMEESEHSFGRAPHQPHLLRHSFSYWWKAQDGPIQSTATVDLHGALRIDDVHQHYGRFKSEVF